ncbi:putative fused malic enzyme oxidoreductase; putative phosphotransacetylase [Beijerinckiaceae bacterium RH AL1]|nr:putative fused malic enzyme oxidoreductase; putative phosphotransacetylase [Beijerinckiaceae bacterium RH CH11]VVB46266.1 putative fused malic enzyme oxidoreductase; putative phosphotransacetylase [Beijerinckiaceae bacterium RH AL8]VVC55244.1 putative fused malic enzyme oxidoreductase; putative phosphotransacetylase [Beijerinckiaceae bacterium RH AL1]
MADPITAELATAALAFHRQPRPGKLEIQATKPLATQRDLALAYSPGVAAACLAIAGDPAEADEMTIRQNLVAVLSNGTAVLGLGDIGPLASKPVMEGKAVLFKKFAGIDVFDIEVDAKDPLKLIEVVAALEPTFGGINLEDIKAPECFEVERTLRERMKIPVFHDDQHGTAIIVAAAVTNALTLGGKQLAQAKIVASGAGAAALACLDLLVTLGARHENITVTDIEGVVYAGRTTLMDPRKAIYARDTHARTLGEVIEGADVFLGLSAGGVLKREMLAKMADKPLIMALANPYPEIEPAEAIEARPDAMICTGRSDYPNQVNNVICFPYIFRGALDVSASAINEEMKLAAVHAIASLAQEPPSDVVAKAYGGQSRLYGKDSLIPSPFDPRLILRIAPAVAKAAMDSGVARKPITDFAAYRDRLSRFVFRSGFIMKPLMEAARKDPKRVIYADGEDERVLSAIQTMRDEKIAFPIVIGRPDVIRTRLQRYGLTIKAGEDFEIVDPEDDPRYRDYVTTYVQAAGRSGITPDSARLLVRTNPTIIGAIALRRGDADALICGIIGGFHKRLRSIREIIGLMPNASDFSAMSMLITNKGPLFITDTQVRHDPSAKDIAEMAQMSARHVRRFGIEPKIALVSHSDFGTDDSPAARKMRDALELIRIAAPELEVDGEMQADTALSQVVRDRILPGSTLKGEANILVMPNIDAANIAYQLTKVMADALPVGPILIGAAQPAHILTPAVTARGVLNMTALAVREAQSRAAS